MASLEVEDLPVVEEVQEVFNKYNRKEFAWEGILGTVLNSPETKQNPIYLIKNKIIDNFGWNEINLMLQ